MNSQEKYRKNNKEKINKQAKKYREKNKEIIKKRKSKWYYINKKKIQKKMKEYKIIWYHKNKNNPLIKKKLNARWKALYYYKELPILCQICNKKKAIERHHFNYSKPLEVIFCCKECHIKLDQLNYSNFKILKGGKGQ